MQTVALSLSLFNRYTSYNLLLNLNKQVKHPSPQNTFDETSVATLKLKQLTYTLNWLAFFFNRTKKLRPMTKQSKLYGVLWEQLRTIIQKMPRQGDRGRYCGKRQIKTLFTNLSFLPCKFLFDKSGTNRTMCRPSP